MLLELLALCTPAATVTVVQNAPVVARELVVDRGPGRLALHVPADEQLELHVIVEVPGVGDVRAGTLSLHSGTELSEGPEGVPGRSGWIRGRAVGDYLAYQLDHVVQTRVRPGAAWPRVVMTGVQTGTENRRRELRYGPRDGALASWFRSDGHCKAAACARVQHVDPGGLFSEPGHCAKCRRADHRIWEEPQERELPEGTLDTLSGIFLSRSIVRSGKESVTFPLIDKTRLWNVTMARGERKEITTSAGTFDCRRILLSTAVPEGEGGEGGAEGADEEPEGPFGIDGTIDIWLEAETGVPVRVAGEIPLGPIALRLRLDLASYAGVPQDFAPVD